MKIPSLLTASALILGSSVATTIAPPLALAQSSNVPASVVRSCRERAVREFNSNQADIEVYDTTTNRQGTYTVFLRSRQVGISIACEVARDGTIQSFAAAPVNAQPSNPVNVPAVVVRSCRVEGLARFGAPNLADVEAYRTTINRQGTYTVFVRSRRTGTSATCEANRDGAILRFVLGQKSNTEDVLRFQTQTYAVRVYRQGDRLYMNVFNKQSGRAELSAALARRTTVDGETEYVATRDLTYYARVTPNRRFNLEIVRGDRVIIQEPGISGTIP
jgi:hypothetical protein